MIEICKKLEWLRPYAEEGMKMISPCHKLQRIGAWSIGKSRGKEEFAALLQRKIGGPHRIWLHTHYDKDKRFSKIDLLNHLAHEMAHMEDWKHTPRHKRLEAKITRKFMRMLENDGYISEEVELK